MSSYTIKYNTIIHHSFPLHSIETPLSASTKHSLKNCKTSSEPSSSKIATITNERVEPSHNVWHGSSRSIGCSNPRAIELLRWYQSPSYNPETIRRLAPFRLNSFVFASLSPWSFPSLPRFSLYPVTNPHFSSFSFFAFFLLLKQNQIICYTLFCY